MWETAFESIVANGAWAVLFCLLLVYELKDSRRRENKYQQTVDSLAAALGELDGIRSDIVEIKEAVCTEQPRGQTAKRDCTHKQTPSSDDGKEAA